MRHTLTAVLVVPALLLLGACGNDDGPDTTTTEAETPGDATTTSEADPEGPDDGVEPEPIEQSPATDPEEAVRSFMDARISGSGAEAHLTEFATDIYPDEIALYDVASFQVLNVEAADANSFEVTVEVTDDSGTTRNETIFVGPGESVDGTNLPFAIRGAVVT